MKPSSGEKYTYTYENGNLKTITDKQGAQFHLTFGRNQELKELSYPKGLKRHWEYDVKGRLVKSVDVKGNATKYGYDKADNLIRLEEADGNVHAFDYSESGDLIKAKDKLHEVEFSYGPMGVLTGRKQNSHAVRFAYDSELQLRSITNENDERYLFDLDGTGNVIKEIGFDGLTREYIRDGAGRAKRVVRPNEKWTDYDYDGTGRVIRETQYDGKVTLYNYDYDGLLKQAENARNDGEETGKNALTFKRDRAGRITAETQGEHTVNRVYDKDGNLTQTTSSLGADIRYDHDDDGNLMKIRYSGHMHPLIPVISTHSLCTLV